MAEAQEILENGLTVEEAEIMEELQAHAAAAEEGDGTWLKEQQHNTQPSADQGEEDNGAQAVRYALSYGIHDLLTELLASTRVSTAITSAGLDISDAMGRAAGQGYLQCLETALAEPACTFTRAGVLAAIKAATRQGWMEVVQMLLHHPRVEGLLERDEEEEEEEEEDEAVTDKEATLNVDVEEQGLK